MKRIIPAFLFLFLGLTAFGLAAEQTKPKAKPVDKSVETSTITREDLSLSINKLEKALCKILKLETVTLTDIHDQKAASREEIIRSFDRLYELAKPKFKFVPKPITFDANRITIKKDTPERKMLEKMIKYQFIAKVGAIAAGKNPSITVAEYGDALGFFIARVADLTHTPDAEWSPYLQADDPVPSGKDKSKQETKSK